MKPYKIPYKTFKKHSSIQYKEIIDGSLWVYCSPFAIQLSHLNTESQKAILNRAVEYPYVDNGNRLARLIKQTQENSGKENIIKFTGQIYQDYNKNFLIYSTLNNYAVLINEDFCPPNILYGDVGFKTFIDDLNKPSYITMCCNFDSEEEKYLENLIKDFEFSIEEIIIPKTNRWLLSVDKKRVIPKQQISKNRWDLQIDE